MQAFKFRLEKVLAWRGTELELEQYKMKKLSAELDEIRRRRAQLAVERTAAESAVLNSGRVDGAELAVHSAFLVHLAQGERDLQRRRLEQEARVAEQHGRLMEARRRFRLLERLKARRHAQWQLEVNRETENFAAEAHLARWKPGKS